MKKNKQKILKFNVNFLNGNPLWCVKFPGFSRIDENISRWTIFLKSLMVFLSGWLIGLFDGLVPGWWWVHGTGGGNMQREQTSPCSLCPNSGSSGIKQQKWDTASQGGQVGSRIDHWWRWSEQKSPPKNQRRRELPSGSHSQHRNFFIWSLQVYQNSSSGWYVATIVSRESVLKPRLDDT